MHDIHINKVLHEEMDRENVHYGNDAWDDIRAFIMDMHVCGTFIPDDPVGYNGEINDPGANC